MNVIRFILSALLHGVAYIDCDGTILCRLRVPSDLGGDWLGWWMRNLVPTPVIKRRLPLLYLLRLLGTRLVLWTNRYDQHKALTRHALGWHGKLLFSDMRFYNGLKGFCKLNGPVIDDRPEHVRQGTWGSLLVEEL